MLLVCVIRFCVAWLCVAWLCVIRLCVFGRVAYLFSIFGGSFQLDCPCLSILGVSDIVLPACSYIFYCIFCISRSEN